MAGTPRDSDNAESQGNFEPMGGNDPASCTSHNMASMATTSSERNVLKLSKCDDAKSSKVALSMAPRDNFGPGVGG